MKRNKACASIPVKLLASTPRGDVRVSGERAARPLPSGPNAGQPEAVLACGPYLEAVRRFIFKDSCRQTISAVSIFLGRSVALAEIEGMEIRTEKHGACYQVARLNVSVSGTVLSFVVNVAVDEAGKSTLQREFRLLRRLARRYRYSYLPQVYFKGAVRYREQSGAARWLHMFVGEWFRGYHEFHLHRSPADDTARILLWDSAKGYRYLTDEQCSAIYRQAARILTEYYDWNSFRQIHPWHHAAGDFVVREQSGHVDVRLITVRGHASVVDFKTRKRAGRLLALVLFFLHLTVQMRLDRLDGVGEVVWAGDSCLDGVVAGFFEGLAARDERGGKGMPSASELRWLLSCFSRGEWLEMLGEMLETYSFSQEELSLIKGHGLAHVVKLQQILNDLLPAIFAVSRHQFMKYPG